MVNENKPVLLYNCGYELLKNTYVWNQDVNCKPIGILTCNRYLIYTQKWHLFIRDF